jgi:Uracil DNA glycosylase superfamily
VTAAIVNTDDYPRSMRDAAVRGRRRAMLHEPHIEPLTAYAVKLRKRGYGDVPDFDPLDGGTHAQVLFLFEKPGPMTAKGGTRRGSGFISRNNDDPTAEATFNFMKRAGIPRKVTVTWNLIPGWNGTRKVTGQELRDGLSCLEELILLLPKLRAVVLVGKQAAKAAPHFKARHPDIRLFTSAHPSPLVRAKFPDRWNSIPAKWAEARTAR